MTWKENAVSREAPASLEARFTADRSTFSKKTLLFHRNNTFCAKPRYDDLGEAKVSHVKLRETVSEFSE